MRKGWLGNKSESILLLGVWTGSAGYREDGGLYGIA